MSTATLLLQRDPASPLAWLSKSLNGLDVPEQGLTIGNAQFLTHVRRVIEKLPDAEHAINVCDNRYVFLVTLCAVALKRQTNLLPANKNLATQADLTRRYPASYVVHDGLELLNEDIPSVDISGLDWSLHSCHGDIPTIALNHPAVISFTSGSTGESKPNLKSWRTLQDSSRINARYMLPSSTAPHYNLATVPGQHMWGLETSVLLPMFTNACLVDARPLYPVDILNLLTKLPAPRILISTPVHLRALALALEENRSVAAELATILCATAPLSQSLANRLEQLFATQLREVYGCSEVGSMAVRRTGKETLWTPFGGLRFRQLMADRTEVSTDYLPAPVELEDNLIFNQDGQFELKGRASDQIKIAGKRGSLHEVNLVLERFSGCRDGVVFFPEQDRAVPRLVALVVLEEGVDKRDLRAHFRQYLDSAFIPRPIYVVDQLPRAANGKLQRAEIASLYQFLRKGSSNQSTDSLPSQES